MIKFLSATKFQIPEAAYINPFKKRAATYTGFNEEVGNLQNIFSIIRGQLGCALFTKPTRAQSCADRLLVCSVMGYHCIVL